MTQAEILQAQIMGDFLGRLCNLTDRELMQRKQAEIELKHSIKDISAELNRRNREL